MAEEAPRPPRKPITRKVPFMLEIPEITRLDEIVKSCEHDSRAAWMRWLLAEWETITNPPAPAATVEPWTEDTTQYVPAELAITAMANILLKQAQATRAIIQELPFYKREALKALEAAGWRHE